MWPLAAGHIKGVVVLTVFSYKMYECFTLRPKRVVVITRWLFHWVSKCGIFSISLLWWLQVHFSIAYLSFSSFSFFSSLPAISSLRFLKVLTTSDTSLLCSFVGISILMFVSFFSTFLVDVSVPERRLSFSTLPQSDPVSTPIQIIHTTFANITFLCAYCINLTVDSLKLCSIFSVEMHFLSWNST